MPLSDDQISRVKNAIKAGAWSDSIADKLRELRTPEELHQFALNHNINDGFNPAWLIIRSPLCDKGTALYIYWLFDEFLLAPHEQRSVISSPNQGPGWDIAGLVAEIERRYQTGLYARQEISFNPREQLNWTSDEEQRFNSGEFSFPGEMLAATPGRPMVREWIS